MPDPAPVPEMQFGSLKPMCYGCCRRAFGRPKDGGWWCKQCREWIVKPPRKAVKRGK